MEGVIKVMEKPNYVTECIVHVEGKDAVEEFVKLTGKFDFDIDILDPTRHYVIDAKSIMGIFSLDLRKDLILGINLTGSAVDEFKESISKFIVNGGE